MISAQAFGNPNASLDLGLDQTDVTQTSGIWIVFPRSVRYAFDLVLTVSGGEFADDLVEASSYVLGDRASPTEGAEYALAGAPATCANFPTNATRVVLRSCGVASGTAQTDTTPAITAVQITDLSINKAGGLASAGNSVTLTATLRDADANEDVHTSTPANIYTSVHSAQARIVTGAPLHVSPDLDPPFTKFTNPAEGSNSSKGVLGRAQLMKRDNALRVTDDGAIVTAATDGVVGTNLTPVPANGVVSSATVKVTHPAFGDDAFSNVMLGDTMVPNPRATPPTTIKDGAADFTVSVGDFIAPPLPAAAATAGTPIAITFDGTSRISSWGAGNAAVTFKDAAADALTVPPGASGALARINRGGMNVHLNAVRNSVGNGADLYQSVIRLTNNGVVSGRVDVTVYDGADGIMVGEFTSDMIPAGTTLQWLASDIEAAAGISAREIALYDIRIEGAITGYAQHLNWNSVDNLFSDLSGFRRGELQGQP